MWCGERGERFLVAFATAICKVGIWVSLLCLCGFLLELLLRARSDEHPYGMTDALHRPKLIFHHTSQKIMCSLLSSFFTASSSASWKYHSFKYLSLWRRKGLGIRLKWRKWCNLVLDHQPGWSKIRCRSDSIMIFSYWGYLTVLFRFLMVVVCSLWQSSSQLRGKRDVLWWTAEWEFFFC